MPSFSDLAGFEGFLFCGGAGETQSCPTAQARIFPAATSLGLQLPRWSLNRTTNNRLPTNSPQAIERSAMKHVILLLAAASVSFIIAIPQFASAQFATSVISYERGAGFSPNFTNATAALG